MKLRPCPFCGHEAEIERKGDRRQSTIYRCTFCGCTLETGEEWGFGTQWNNRSGAAKVELEKLKEALSLYQKSADFVGPCSDGDCMIPVDKVRGMHTNGGCRCNTDLINSQIMMRAGQSLARALKEYLE